MRVLIAHSRYRQPGGEERSVELLVDGLRARGVDVRLFEPSSAELDTALSRVAAGAGMVYRPSAARAVRTWSVGWKPDVLHVHNLLPGLSPSVLREGKRLGAGVVLTAHNYRLVCPAGTLTRRGRVHDDCVRGSSFVCGLRGARSNFGESLLYGAAVELHRRLRLVDRWVDRYITPSAYVRDVLAAAGVVRSPAERISLVPYGVPTPDRIADQRSHGLFVGRLSEEKGLGTLLAAAALMPEVPLVIAGDGPEAPAVDAAVLPNVRRVGHLPHAELDHLRASAAFTVVPSEWPENQPYAALESLAAGVPLVAARVGGLVEVACDVDSLLVEAGNPSALADAMRRAWRSARSEAAWGEDARRLAVERFSLDSHVSSILDVYEEVTTGRQLLEIRSQEAPRPDRHLASVEGQGPWGGYVRRRATRKGGTQRHLKRIRRLEKRVLGLLVRTHNMTTERHGSAYGGWVIPAGVLGPDSIVYSGGVGEDATFDESIIDSYGCTVFAFDPTPRSIAFAARIHESRFHFLPVGLWSEDSFQEFQAPADPEHVSHSIGSASGPTGGFTAQCRSIESLMRQLEHSELTLLKLDIEGAEDRVLRSLPGAGVKPHVLCVEMHGGLTRSLGLIRFLRKQGYVPVAMDGWNATLAARLLAD